MVYKRPMGRVVVFVAFAVWVVGCTGYRKSRSDLPKEERGGAELLGLLVDLKETLNKRDIKKAEAILHELEDGVQNADAVTASHPDFEDIQRSTKQARLALDATKRVMAIEDLSKRTEPLLMDGRKSVQRLRDQGPDQTTLADLEKTTEKLEELRQLGLDYRDDQRYGQQAALLDQSLQDFAIAHVEYSWVLAMSGDFNAAVEKGRAADQNSRTSTKAAEQLAAAEMALEKFSQCQDLAQKWRGEKGYSTSLKFKTAFGLMTLDEAALSCDYQRLAIEKRMEELKFRAAVGALLDPVDESLGAVRAEKDLVVIVEKIPSARHALKECVRGLKHQPKALVDKESIKFTTLLGTHHAAKLRAACEKESDALPVLEATLKWRLAVEEQKTRYTEAKSALQNARNSEGGVSRDELRKIRSTLEKCIAKTQELVEQKKSEWKKADPKEAEKRAVVGQREVCEARLDDLKTFEKKTKDKPRDKKRGKK